MTARPLALLLAASLACASSLWPARAISQHPFSWSEEVLRIEPDESLTAFASGARGRYLYVGGDRGSAWISSDFGQTWSSALISAPDASFPGRSEERARFGLWPLYFGFFHLGRASAIDYPQIHGTVNLFRPHEVFTPQAFGDISDISTNPFILRTVPRAFNQITRRELRLRPETHTHESFAQLGGDYAGYRTLRFESGRARRLRAALRRSYWAQRARAPVRALAASSFDGRHVAAATEAGLYRSEDAGRSWRRVAASWSGGAVDELSDVRFDPDDPDLLYLCGPFGAGVLSYGASSVSPVVGAGEGALLGCQFERSAEPGAPRYAIASGEVWRLDWGAGAPRAERARLFGGAAIERAARGGAAIAFAGEREVFLGMEGGGIEAIGAPDVGASTIIGLSVGAGGRVLVASERDVWSYDVEGRAWRTLSYGETSAEIAQLDAGGQRSWIVGERSLMRLAEGALGSLSAPSGRALRVRWSEEPTASALVAAGLRRAELLRPDGPRTRSAARWAHALPQLHAVVGAMNVEIPGIELNTVATQLAAPIAFRTSGAIEEWYIGLQAHWNQLGDLLYDAQEIAPTGAVESRARQRLGLRRALAGLYAERRRLQMQQAAGSERGRAWLMRRERLAELGCLIDALSGGALGDSAPGCAGE